MKSQLQEVMEIAFATLEFQVIHFNVKPSANGVDMWVQKNGKRPLSVEIKRVRKQKSGMYQVDPVLKTRAGDDLIAIIINSKYILIEPMKDHLKSCSKMGTRQFTLML